jgi:hypothetical protein
VAHNNAPPYSGTERPERGHKGGEGERGMKDTGKDTPSIRRVGMNPVGSFYLVRCLMSDNWILIVEEKVW